MQNLPRSSLREPAFVSEKGYAHSSLTAVHRRAPALAPRTAAKRRTKFHPLRNSQPPSPSQDGDKGCDNELAPEGVREDGGLGMKNEKDRRNSGKTKVEKKKMDALRTVLQNT